MKYKLLTIALLGLVVLNFAQQKKAGSIASQPILSAKITKTVQLDSTAVFTNYYEGKFFSFTKDGGIVSSDTTGKVLWKQQIPGNISAEPVLVENILVIATDNNDINTFDIKTGSQLQSIGVEDKITTPLFAFNYAGTNELMIPKQTNSKAAVVFGMANGKISCLDLETLQEYWQNGDQKDTLYTKLILLNNKLVFTRGDGSLNSIDANTGLLIWRWQEEELSNFSKANLETDGKSIFVVSADSVFHSINFLLGRLNWRLENIKVDSKFFYSTSQKNLYLISSNEKLIIFSVKDEVTVDDFKLRYNLPNNSYNFFEFEKKVFFVYNGIIYEAEEKQLLREVLKLDFAAIKSFYQLGENKFAALSYNGKLTIFIMR
ncbi:MAG: PQQ-binding-like beta-propeller repeat protein [Ignavibacteriales bacterium]|nr:PQQ-binding-like beta-propeller repeat protein [Ignavibacteriales bacterium]